MRLHERPTIIDREGTIPKRNKRRNMTSWLSEGEPLWWIIVSSSRSNWFWVPTTSHNSHECYLRRVLSSSIVVCYWLSEWDLTHWRRNCTISMVRKKRSWINVIQVKQAWLSQRGQQGALWRRLSLYQDTGNRFLLWHWCIRAGGGQPSWDMICWILREWSGMIYTEWRTILCNWMLLYCAEMDVNPRCRCRFWQRSGQRFRFAGKCLIIGLYIIYAFWRGNRNTPNLIAIGRLVHQWWQS